MAQRRDNDNDLIEDAEELAGGAQSGSAGGNLAREVGQRDEEKTARGGDPEPTQVNKSDKADDGDMTTPPQRHQ
jgi:hypothetical protein